MGAHVNRETGKLGRMLGIVLVVLSTVVYLLLFGVPFLPVATEVKAGVSVMLVVVGEVTFWAGAALLGRELVARFRHALNPRTWFCRQKRDMR
jgi:hypothetical protein